MRIQLVMYSKESYPDDDDFIHKGIFHKWTLDSGTDPGVSETYGIIEMEDGRVCLLKPSQIKFIDRVPWDMLRAEKYE